MKVCQFYCITSCQCASFHCTTLSRHFPFRNQCSLLHRGGAIVEYPPRPTQLPWDATRGVFFPALPLQLPYSSSYRRLDLGSAAPDALPFGRAPFSKSSRPRCPPPLPPGRCWVYSTTHFLTNHSENTGYQPYPPSRAENRVINLNDGRVCSRN